MIIFSSIENWNKRRLPYRPLSLSHHRKDWQEGEMPSPDVSSVLCLAVIPWLIHSPKYVRGDRLEAGATVATALLCILCHGLPCSSWANSVTGFPNGSGGKNLPAAQEMWVQPLGQEHPLGKEMAAHSGALAWEIPQTWQELGRLQSLLLQRVGHDLETKQH